MPAITYGKTNITYQLERKYDVSYIKIYLDDLNGVHVTAAKQKSEDRIEAFIRKKALWIKQKWQETHSDLYHIDQLTLDDEQRISYLGRSYQLFSEPISNEDEPSFRFQKSKFYYHYPKVLSKDEAQRLLIQKAKIWFREKSEQKLPTLTDHDIEIEEDSIRLGIKESDLIHLNWRIVQQPKDTIKQTIRDLWEEKTC
ncbi:YgjP-like metallopeptidase domain-containing protein [Halobacillus litoralis]|uniref:YgjP-like metallopeptidase domain-containing protein n=1 Tax=Halobacillus litoralis TaxID=45668 RepID=A0A410M9J5_9BACI|nr:YgjP-like metallopeptidase domain-containing protein [Halobacillus litoralis]QAS51357.1 hypothetical protein HLI_03570 [Halobacillus litoralis]